MQPSERSPKWRPALAKGIQRTNKDNQILPHFFGSVDKASSILFPYFRIVPLAVQLFAFAAFIAISDERFSSGLLPSLDGCSDLIPTHHGRTSQ
jgi:hypothetical protein